MGVAGGAVVQEVVGDEVVVAPAASACLGVGHHAVADVALLPVEQDGLGKVPAIL